MEIPDNSSRVPATTTVTRRKFVGTVVATGAAASLAGASPDTAEQAPSPVHCTLNINNEEHELQLDPRVTLLDLLREQLHLTGAKKGCDHGQCGACTVLINGVRMNSCLSFAVMHQGDYITTIEGLAEGNNLHPMQAAFLEHDGFQCGYCTPGQICSAVAMLEEVKKGAPSFVTPDIAHAQPVNLTDDEIRERMSGNICRCAAYPNIIAAIRAVHPSAKGADAPAKTAKGFSKPLGGASNSAAVLRVPHPSAKGADAPGKTARGITKPLAGAPNSATVLRVS